MSEKENLTPFQIQLLLYYLTAEPKKRTVTDAARYLNKPKSTLTHILDSLDELALMERVEGRKSVLTAAGERTAQQLLHQRKILEQYMQYQDIPPISLWSALPNRRGGCASRRFLPGTATFTAGISATTSRTAAITSPSSSTGSR